MVYFMPVRFEIQPTDNNFARLRKQARLSQRQLAKILGCASSTIYRWENYNTEPTFTVSQMSDFCEAVQRDFYDLPKKLAE